jgi:hypothetical protein
VSALAETALISRFDKLPGFNNPFEAIEAILLDVCSTDFLVIYFSRFPPLPLESES